MTDMLISFNKRVKATIFPSQREINKNNISGLLRKLYSLGCKKAGRDN